MKRIISNLEKWMNAVTFAEAGEWETACTMMPKPKNNKTITEFEKLFMAVTFAEAGIHEEALRIMKEPQPACFCMEDFFSAVGLNGVRVRYVVCNVETAL